MPRFSRLPTAWAIQNTMNKHVKHDPKCSVFVNCFLCDCGGVIELYNKMIK